MYTCFLDNEPAWRCKDLGVLISHVQDAMDNCIMASVGGGNIFQGKAAHDGVEYVIAIREVKDEVNDAART